MTSRGTKPSPGGLPELQRAQRDYLKLAVKLANARMREEVYPVLQKRLGMSLPVRQWNPLRSGSLRVGDLSMKISNPQSDPFIREILQDGSLSQMVETIVVESLETAIERNITLKKTPFLTAILRDLMKEDATVQAEDSSWPEFTFDTWL